LLFSGLRQNYYSTTIHSPKIKNGRLTDAEYESGCPTVCYQFMSHVALSYVFNSISFILQHRHLTYALSARGSYVPWVRNLRKIDSLKTFSLFLQPLLNFQKVQHFLSLLTPLPLPLKTSMSLALYFLPPLSFFPIFRSLNLSPFIFLKLLRFRFQFPFSLSSLFSQFPQLSISFLKFWA